MARVRDATTIRRAVRAGLRKDTFLEDSHTHRLDRHTFTIYVGGEPDAPFEDEVEPGVEFMMADRFEMNLGTLSGIDPKRPILVVLASMGGDWSAGMQMFSAILTCPNPITVLATRWARSMTSIIPLAADKFAIRPPAKYMFHYGSACINGIWQEIYTEAIEHIRDSKTMQRLYVARLREQGRFRKLPEDDIERMLVSHMRERIDVWMGADEAKSWGFVDEVFVGNYERLRAKRRNEERRARMMAVLREQRRVSIRVT